MRSPLNRPRRRPHRRAQSLVEFAILFPAMVFIILGAVSIDSYIQAKSQLEQAVSRAALVGARANADVCDQGDPYYGVVSPVALNTVVGAFESALSAPVFANQKTAIATALYNQSAGSYIKCIDSTGTLDSTNAGQLATNSLTHPGCYNAGGPLDNGCFGLWRGGTITVYATFSLNVTLTPFWRSVTISASASEQIEPFRSHTNVGCGSTLTPPSPDC